MRRITTFPFVFRSSVGASIPTLAFIAALAIAGTVAKAETQGRAIDVAHSMMTVSVYKQGIFAFAADNHEVDVPIAEGSFDAASSSVRVLIHAADLRVLDPKMAPDKRAEVQANMVGPRVLDAAAYPTIEFRSTAISVGDGSDWTVRGDLTLHGQTHAISVSVTKLDGTHYRGTAVVRQSDFGIEPIKIAGGVVKVKDDVDVAFEIAL